MSTCSWDKKGLVRAQAHSLLTPRIEINQKCQEKDFQYWLQSKIQPLPSENVLDLACGDGAQTIYFARRIGPRGRILAVDINHDSLESLREKSVHLGNISIVESDMMLTDNYLNGESADEFTLINCSFALPYAENPLELVNSLAGRLAPQGRLANSLPVEPHGMVEFCSKIHQIPQSVWNSIQYGEKFLMPHMRSLFAELDVHFFNDRINFGSTEDFMRIYSSSTYYSEEFAEDIEKQAAKLLTSDRLSFTKGSILIIGRDLFAS